jgi:hypothetical protein
VIHGLYYEVRFDRSGQEGFMHLKGILYEIFLVGVGGWGPRQSSIRPIAPIADNDRHLSALLWETLKEGLKYRGDQELQFTF